MNMKFGSIILVIILFALGCRTQKKLINKPVDINKNHGLINNSSEKYVDSVVSRYIRYNAVKIKFEIEYQNNNENNDLTLNGLIRLRKDSLILITLGPGLGIDVAKIQFSKDSVKFVNNLNRSYFTENYEFFKRVYKIDLNYFSIQSLLMNEIFVLSENEGNKSNIKLFKNEIVGKFISLTNLSKDSVNLKISEKKGIKYVIDSISYKVDNEEYIDYANNRKLKINYSNFEIEEKQIFPKNIEMDFSDSANSLNIKILYKKINFEKVFLRTVFRIQDKYKRIKTFEK
jgi:hypothetical protein